MRFIGSSNVKNLWIPAFAGMTFLKVALRRKQLKGHPFFRQKIIRKYIVDFYCPKANLVIELDGGQHDSETGKAKGKIRDDDLILV